MKVYLAALGLQKKLHDYVLNNFPEFGVLCSFANPKEYYGLKEAGFKDIMLDSGAYTAFTKGTQIDIDEYVKFIQDENVSLCVNLDVIGNDEASKNNWEYMKRVPLPVFHAGGDVKYLEYYIDTCEYIGIGNMAKLHITKRLKFLDMLYSEYPYRKYHIFGVQSQKVLSNYPVYSCDGTAWMNGIKMGWVMTRHGNYFLNKKEKDCIEIKEWLFEKYGLGGLNDYESQNEFGIEITKVSLHEMKYMFVDNHNPIVGGIENRSLF